jgi:ABC-type transporter Mla subunit MlaD
MLAKIEKGAVTAFVILCALFVLLMMVWMTLVMFGVMTFPSVYVCAS